MLDHYLLRLGHEREKVATDKRLREELGLDKTDLATLVKLAQAVPAGPPAAPPGPPPGGAAPPPAGPVGAAPPPGAVEGPPPEAPPPPMPEPAPLPAADIGSAVGAALKTVRQEEEAEAAQVQVQNAVAEAAAAQEAQAAAAEQAAQAQMPPTFPPGQEPMPAPPMMPPPGAKPPGGMPPAAAPAAGGAGMPKMAFARALREKEAAGLQDTAVGAGAGAAVGAGAGYGLGRYVKQQAAKGLVGQRHSGLRYGQAGPMPRPLGAAGSQLAKATSHRPNFWSAAINKASKDTGKSPSKLLQRVPGRLAKGVGAVGLGAGALYGALRKSAEIEKDAGDLREAGRKRLRDARSAVIRTGEGAGRKLRDAFLGPAAEAPKAKGSLKARAYKVLKHPGTRVGAGLAALGTAGYVGGKYLRKKEAFAQAFALKLAEHEEGHEAESEEKPKKGLPPALRANAERVKAVQKPGGGAEVPAGLEKKAKYWDASRAGGAWRLPSRLGVTPQTEEELRELKNAVASGRFGGGLLGSGIGALGGAAGGRAGAAAGVIGGALLGGHLGRKASQRQAEREILIRRGFAKKKEETTKEAFGRLGKGILGAGALTGVGAASGVVGHKKGRKTGQGEGLRVGYGLGARKGYSVGAQRGYRAGIVRGYRAAFKQKAKQKAAPKGK